MTIKARTTRTENDLATFARDNRIPLSSLDHSANSSGMLTLFYRDAGEEVGTVVFGTDDTTGAAPGAAYGTSFTDAINVANASKVTLFITVVANNASTLTIFPRLSRIGTPVVATEADWYRPLDGASSSTFYSYVVDAAVMTAAATKFMVEIDVSAANWASFSFAGNAAHEITVIAEPVA